MKKPRLTDLDRKTIESMLKEGKNIYAIAKALSRPVTTITREIKARAVESDKGAAYRVANRCAFKMQCAKRNICAHCPYDEKRFCKFCRLCNSHCSDYVEQKCERLDNPPFVCNGCPDERKCVLRKRFYIHGAAQRSYETILSESRSGANITEGERLAFDALLHDLTGKGQSVYAAMSNNPDKFSISLKTCYRYINSGLLSNIYKDENYSLVNQMLSDLDKKNIEAALTTLKDYCAFAKMERISSRLFDLHCQIAECAGMERPELFGGKNIEPTTVRLWVDYERAEGILSNPLHQSQRLEQEEIDGSINILLNIPITEEFEIYLAKNHKQIMVTSPTSLANKVKKLLGE